MNKKMTVAAAATAYKTIDEKHQEIMNRLKENEELNLPELLKRKSKLKKTIVLG